MINELVAGLKKKEVRSLGKLISLAENGDPEIISALSELYSSTGKAAVIGITGPPGAGKSTLVGELIKRIREQKKTVAVIAVDPVSPFTGGALLGDRIRLTEHFNDPGVFIRSLSTRGKLGGLSRATREALDLADAFGFDYIFLETVGVGQSEVAVQEFADLTMLVLVPEWGDGIQALKAGILEIGDLFVVHKSDREGADRIEGELKTLLQISGKSHLPILKTAQSDSKSLAELFQMIQSHFSDKAKVGVRRKNELNTSLEMVRNLLAGEVNDWLHSQPVEAKNPYEAVVRFRKSFPKGFLQKQ